MFTISAHGVVRQVGRYSGPGADEVLVAPAGFGSAGGQALLTLDGGTNSGALVAMNASGKTRTLSMLPGGLNPIAAIPANPPKQTKQAPPAGLYVTNDSNPYVYFVAASRATRKELQGATPTPQLTRPQLQPRRLRVRQRLSTRPNFPQQTRVARLGLAGEWKAVDARVVRGERARVGEGAAGGRGGPPGGLNKM